MPKTRRAGRKYQLRRLHAKLFYPATTDDSAYVGVNYQEDSEYDNHFLSTEPSPASPQDPTRLSATVPTYKVTPIDIDDTLRLSRERVPRAYHPKDPRPAFFKLLRAEALNHTLFEDPSRPLPTPAELRTKAHAAFKAQQRTAEWVREQTHEAFRAQQLTAGCVPKEALPRRTHG